MMAANRARIADAVAADFGAHPKGASDLIEVLGVIGRAARDRSGRRGHPGTQRMPLSLVVDPPADLRVMQEEILGSILPVVPYDDLGAAVDAIVAGERPLGLYVFGDDAGVTDGVLAATSSGGAAVNTCAVQSALPNMGFGGSGSSGMGRHHGPEGFREFSNPRGVVVRGSGDDLIARRTVHLLGVAWSDGAAFPDHDRAASQAGARRHARVLDARDGGRLRCRSQARGRADDRSGRAAPPDPGAGRHARARGPGAGPGRALPAAAGRGGPPAGRIGTVLSSALLRRQVERIELPNRRTFADEPEALACLLA